MINFLIMC